MQLQSYSLSITGRRSKMVLFTWGLDVGKLGLFLHVISHLVAQSVSLHGSRVFQRQMWKLQPRYENWLNSVVKVSRKITQYKELENRLYLMLRTVTCCDSISQPTTVYSLASKYKIRSLSPLQATPITTSLLSLKSIVSM